MKGELKCTITLTNGDGQAVSAEQHSAFGITGDLTMHSKPTKNDTQINHLELCLLTGHLIRRWVWNDEQWQEEPVSYGVYKSVIS